MGNNSSGAHSATPYDDVFRTMFTDCPELIIPVTNELFNTNYPIDIKVENLSTSLSSDDDTNILRREADSCIKILNRVYHIECQSSYDGTMVLRMAEYDSIIALREAHSLFFEDSTSYLTKSLTINWPLSAVIYLRCNVNLPNHYTYIIYFHNRSNGNNEISVNVPILKMQSYTTDELLKKDLVFLFPFHVFAYEKYLNKNTIEFPVTLTEAYSKLDKYLSDKTKRGLLTEYHSSIIRHMIVITTDALSKGNKKIMKGVERIMRGTVLEYEAKTIYREGIKEGIKSGIKEGHLNTLISLVNKNKLSLSDAAKEASLSEEAFKEAMKKQP